MAFVTCKQFDELSKKQEQLDQQVLKVGDLDHTITLSANTQGKYGVVPYDDTDIRNRLIALESKPDNDTKYTAGSGLALTGTSFSANVDDTTIQVVNNKITAKRVDMFGNEF